MQNNKNIFKFIAIWIALVAVFIAAVAALMFVFKDSASAGGGKVRICHATASQSNPYVNIEVDASSIENPNDKKYLNGHGDHEKDIIPPFSFNESSFPGKNWDEAGQAIWNNDCKVILPLPTPTPTEPLPTPTEVPDPIEPPMPDPTEPVETPIPVPTEVPAGGGGLAVEVPALK